MLHRTSGLFFDTFRIARPFLPAGPIITFPDRRDAL
jgi:hypothetical protein